MHTSIAVVASQYNEEKQIVSDWKAKERFDEVWEPRLKAFLSILGAVAIVGGIIIFRWQTYTWLKSGTWVALPLNYYVTKFLEGKKLLLWLTNPKSWYGLNKIVNKALKIPITGVLVFGGMSLIALPVRLWMFLGSIGLIIFLFLLLGQT